MSGGAGVSIALWVALGGAVGSLGRHLISGWAARALGETFPWGTLLVNVAGSFLIGLVATTTGPDGRLLWPGPVRQFVMVGVFGGFTTFSSFSLQTLTLLREGEFLFACANVLGSVALCLGGVWVGHAVGTLVNR